MELKDQQVIKASCSQVFAALNDADILKECIPGCESLTKNSETDMTANVTLKVGPVKAKFAGQVTLSDLNPPHSYTISGSGKAGPAGFAKGTAKMNLVPDENGNTVLQYAVSVDIGGKIAQLGARLMDSTSKKLAGQFFEKFGAIVEAQEQTSEPSNDDASHHATTEQTLPETSQGLSGNMSKVIWVLVAVGATAAAWYFTQ
ncbi:MAG: carbon monoxide dehydrogenase subunit G [Sneathiella sp.]